MSTDNQQTNTTIESQNVQIAAELREINERLKRLARTASPDIDAILQDERHVNEQMAAILEEREGEITQAELNETLYPRGGQR